jgi:hypothetical protein
MKQETSSKFAEILKAAQEKANQGQTAKTEAKTEPEAKEEPKQEEPKPAAEPSKMQSFTIIWHEGTGEFDGQTFATWNGANQAMSKIYRSHSGPGYTKVKVNVKWENGAEITDRCDCSDSSGDFSAKRETIGQYLSRQNSVMYASNLEQGSRNALSFEDALGTAEQKKDRIIAEETSKITTDFTVEQNGIELSGLTIDDILNDTPKANFCAPIAFELPQTKAQTISEETVKICKDIASENKTVAFEIERYSEYSFAVFGDTKPIKEDLKRLGGKFNPCLKYGESKRSGWIFSLRHLEAVRKFLVV